MATSIVIFGFMWVFATFVRKEGEVSMLALKRGIAAVIGWGLFFLMIQYIRRFFF